MADTTAAAATLRSPHDNNSSSSSYAEATAVVVVEAACTAPRQDWPELSCLVRAFVRRCAATAATAAMHDGGGGSNNNDKDDKDAPQQQQQQQQPLRPGQRLSLDGAAAALLAHGVTSLRICDLCPAHVLTQQQQQQQQQHAQQPHASLYIAPVLYTLHRDGDGDDDGDALCTTRPLPHASLDGLWESLHYGESAAASTRLKRELLDYVVASLFFARAGVDVHCVAWNRLLLLYGPPGSGKTSLARALAHKLAVRLASGGAGTDAAHTATSFFAHACLVEVRAHALLSRWFGESGKRVLRVFAHVTRLASDATRLVCVLLDEVETVAAARYGGGDGEDSGAGDARGGATAEPSDAMRLVTALLTQLDALQRLPNVVVVATSNVAGALDAAFADRADKRVYVGAPGLAARHGILCSGAAELLARGLLSHSTSRTVTATTTANNNNDNDSNSRRGAAATAAVAHDAVLTALARTCAGLSGRCLRRLPFLAYSVALGECGGGVAALPLLTTATISTAAPLSSSLLSRQHDARVVGCVPMRAWLDALERCVAHEQQQTQRQAQPAARPRHVAA